MGGVRRVSVPLAAVLSVLICGSRHFADPFTLSLAIDKRVQELPAECIVIVGGAKGADQIAEKAALRHGHPVSRYEADWETHGKRAGIIRNLAMLDAKPDLVIAFWDGISRGTKHTITEARRRGIPVEVVTAQ